MDQNWTLNWPFAILWQFLWTSTGLSRYVPSNLPFRCLDLPYGPKWTIRTIGNIGMDQMDRRDHRDYNRDRPHGPNGQTILWTIAIAQSLLDIILKVAAVEKFESHCKHWKCIISCFANLCWFITIKYAGREAGRQMEWQSSGKTANILWKTEGGQWLHRCHSGLWGSNVEGPQSDPFSLQPLLQQLAQSSPSSWASGHQRGEGGRLGGDGGLHLSRGSKHSPGAAWQISCPGRAASVERNDK